MLGQEAAMTLLDATTLLHSIDALVECQRAALAAIEVLRSIVAGSIQTACNERVEAAVRVVAPAVALAQPAAAPTKKPVMSNTERSRKRRGALAARGYPPKTTGRIERLDEVQRKCNGDSVAPVAPCVAPVAPDSSFSFDSRRDDDGENVRARRCNEKCNENYQRSVAPDDNLVNFRVTADQTENLAADVHRIAQQRARFPHQMLASTTAGYINGLLKNGVSPRTIREAVHWAAPLAKAPIKTFWYFARPDGAIATAQAEAMRAAEIAQPTLPLPATSQRGGQHGRPAQSSEIRHSSTRGSAAQAARRRAEELLAGGGGSA
jgi:hypothetical protein